jgi:hypothetical protein
MLDSKTVLLEPQHILRNGRKKTRKRLKVTIRKIGVDAEPHVDFILRKI